MILAYVFLRTGLAGSIAAHAGGNAGVWILAAWAAYVCERLLRHASAFRGVHEQQLGLFADRTSAHTLRANQLRLWLSSVAYMILNELRRVALAGTELAHAQVSTIRTRLLKIGAIVTTSVRRIYVSLSSVFPFQHVWWRALDNLRRAHS